MALDPLLPTEDLDEIADILARGYRRHCESRSEQREDSLANNAAMSAHVQAVNAAEND